MNIFNKKAIFGTAVNQKENWFNSTAYEVQKWWAWLGCKGQRKEFSSGFGTTPD